MLPQVDMVEAVDRTVECLTNQLGRCPTVIEIADAAGLRAEDVLTSLEASRPLAGMHVRTALYLRCAEGLGRTEIARRMGVRRAEVSRLMRAANLYASPLQAVPETVPPWPRHSQASGSSASRSLRPCSST